MLLSFLSKKLYISLFTISETSPADLLNKSVSSKAGVRISEKLNELNDNFNNSSTLKIFSADWCLSEFLNKSNMPLKD